MRFKITLIVLLSTLHFNSFSQDIDNEMDSCLQKSHSNAEQLACLALAGDRWLLEIEKYEALILQTGPKHLTNEFKAAQKKWLKFKNAEFDMIEEYGKKASNFASFQLISANEKIKLLRNRAKLLQSYYSILTM